MQNTKIYGKKEGNMERDGHYYYMTTSTLRY
jgi:hypothetical protein